jgi:hypothetical protein
VIATQAACRFSACRHRPNPLDSPSKLHNGAVVAEGDAPQPTRLRIRPGEIASAPRAYANNVRVTFTPEDFTIFFGHYSVPPLDQRTPEGEIETIVQPVIQISIPLNLVRPTIAVMQRQLEAYERSFGQVPPNPNPPPWMKEVESVESDGD